MCHYAKRINMKLKTHIDHYSLEFQSQGILLINTIALCIEKCAASIIEVYFSILLKAPVAV